MRYCSDCVGVGSVYCVDWQKKHGNTVVLVASYPQVAQSISCIHVAVPPHRPSLVLFPNTPVLTIHIGNDKEQYEILPCNLMQC